MVPEQENKMSSLQSLELIAGMMAQVKSSQRSDGRFWLLWGWAIFAGVMGQYLMLKMGWKPNWLPWAITMPLAIAAHNYLRIKCRHQQKVRTHVQDVIGHLSIAFFVSLVVTALAGFSGRVGFHSGSTFLILYAIWQYVVGRTIRFKPLWMGGVVSWLCSVGLWFITNVEYYLLLYAFAILAGYLVPGHLMQQEFKKEKAMQKPAS